tara:strand:- start:197 stop:328 length:132 start_codon:yes stop_codon:yes gene_type:complete
MRIRKNNVRDVNYFLPAFYPGSGMGQGLPPAKNVGTTVKEKTT